MSSSMKKRRAHRTGVGTILYLLDPATHQPPTSLYLYTHQPISLHPPAYIFTPTSLYLYTHQPISLHPPERS